MCVYVLALSNEYWYRPQIKITQGRQNHLYATG